LQIQLEQALAKIEQNVQKNKDLAKRISRSPRAIQTVQALEAAIAIFGQNEPKPEYEVSKYATGNRCWRHSLPQHPVPIQDLLLYDVQIKHNQNKILGNKVAEVVRQNIHLAQKVSNAYEPPSEKLKKDPIMGLVTKTVATYMFLKHNNEQNGTTTTQRWGTFQHGGNHFSKRRCESRDNRIKSKNKMSESKKNKSERKSKMSESSNNRIESKHKKCERKLKGESRKSVSQKKRYEKLKKKRDKQKKLKLN